MLEWVSWSYASSIDPISIKLESFSRVSRSNYNEGIDFNFPVKSERCNFNFSRNGRARLIFTVSLHLMQGSLLQGSGSLLQDSLNALQFSTLWLQARDTQVLGLHR